MLTKLLTRHFKVGHLPSISLVRVNKGKVTALTLDNNIGQDKEVNARAHGFRRMIEKVGNKVCIASMYGGPTRYSSRAIRNQLPDMDFPINGKAEGRILVPWEHNEFPEMAVQDTSGAYFFPGLAATV